MPSKVQLIGGGFQDSEGNILANGTLKFRLSQDASVTGVGNICSGIEITVQLDASGNAVTSPVQDIWGNDVLSPVNTFYRVTGYTAQGQPAWGPNNQQVEGSGTFDLGTWVPNSVISWQPTVGQPLVLKVNGTLASSQIVQNLIAETGVTIVDAGNGNIELSASGGGGGALGKWPGNWVGASASGVAQNAFVLTSGGGFGTALEGFGSSSQSGGTGQHATATQGARLKSITNASTSTTGGIIDQAFNLSLGILEDWFTKIQIDTVSSPSRYWMGMSDQTPSNAPTVFFSNTPAANFVGFRYSVNAGDTHFKAICQTGASNQTVVDTGVAPTTGTPQVLEIVPTNSGATVTFYINGVLVATISTNVPATSVAMSSIFGCGDASIVSTFDWFYFWFLLNS